ncbi:hypothetical protein HZA33_00945 [Candidatus Pacearchaeota archaeon]|nr:hypothetical protein [Candidatus Pacearchaeota archaeon]
MNTRGKMRSLGDVLAWFGVTIVLTISIGYFAIITKAQEMTLKILVVLFYGLIVIDGVLFITLIVLIINSVKKEGF